MNSAKRKNGRPAKYKSEEEAVVARRARQKKWINTKRRKIRDAAAREAEVEAEQMALAEAEAEAVVTLAQMPVGIDVDNETEHQRNSETIESMAKQGEFVFQNIEDFATLVNVPPDGNCGYHALIAALDYIKKKAKKTVKEIRRDIWEFGMNHKRYAAKKTICFDRIYDENLVYTVWVGPRRWMNTAEIGLIIAELYDVVFYVYWLIDNAKKTVVYRPGRKEQHYNGGFVLMFKKDSINGDNVVRLFCEHGNHF